MSQQTNLIEKHEHVYIFERRLTLLKKLRLTQNTYVSACRPTRTSKFELVKQSFSRRRACNRGVMDKPNPS